MLIFIFYVAIPLRYIYYFVKKKKYCRVSMRMLKIQKENICGAKNTKENELVSNFERNEVLLNHGDGILDAGLLTKCKNAVCYIYCSKEETEK